MCVRNEQFLCISKNHVKADFYSRVIASSENDNGIGLYHLTWQSAYKGLVVLYHTSRRPPFCGMFGCEEMCFMHVCYVQLKSLLLITCDSQHFCFLLHP